MKAIDSLVADSVDAAVLLRGAYDNEHFHQSTLNYDQSLAAYFTDYPDFRATKGNCIANILNIHCPILLFHGPNDIILQYQQSLELRDSMAAHLAFFPDSQGSEVTAQIPVCPNYLILIIDSPPGGNHRIDPMFDKGEKE